MNAPHLSQACFPRFTESLWRASDFHDRVQQMGAPLRAAFDLPLVHQLGIIVPDVEAAATELERQGLGPFFVAAGAPRFWLEDGHPRDMAGKLGIAYKDGIEIELLEPGFNTNWYRHSLDQGGPYVIQHLGFLHHDVTEAAQPFKAEGFPVKVRGELGSLGLRCHFTYVDTFETFGFMTEFIDLQMMGRRIAPAHVYKPMARLQKLLRARRFDL